MTSKSKSLRVSAPPRETQKEEPKVAGASSSRTSENQEQDAPTTLVPKLRSPEFHSRDISHTKARSHEEEGGIQ